MWNLHRMLSNCLHEEKGKPKQLIEFLYKLHEKKEFIQLIPALQFNIFFLSIGNFVSIFAYN